MIITANKFFKTGFEAYKLMVIVPLADRKGLPTPNQVDASRPLQAYVNHGKWLVKCECGGCEKAWEEEKFFCQSCMNGTSKHKLRIATFPAGRRQIEEQLDVRPLANRNWNNLSDRIRLGHDETVAELKAENKEHKAELLEVS